MSEYTAYFRAQLTGKEEVLRGLQQIENARKKLDGSKVELNASTSGIDRVADHIDKATDKVYNLQNALSGLGSAMQGIGDIMGSIGDFVGNGMGGAFSSMAGMFDTDFMHYAEMWASKAITSTFMGNIKEAANRFDILSTYNSYLAALGIGEEAANASLERLNAGIQGLPLGLSDVAFQARRYAMYMGNDINKATDFTLGLNQALIAGGANEQMRRTTTYEIERLLSVGKLNTARQWNALLQGFGVSVQFLQEQLGASDKTIQEFAAELSDGAIETQDFLNAVAALNGNEGLGGLIDIYKGTVESAMSNIHFALIRGKANIIDAFSETLEAVTGFNLAETINKVRDNLNEIFAGISDYIKSNPELIEGALDRIMGIFDRAKEFDWAGTADKIFDNIGRIVDILTSMWDQLPEGAVSDFVAFATTWAGPLGNAFKAISSGMPFMFALFERMKGFDWETLAQDVFDNVGKLIGRLVDIMNLIPDDVLSKIISWGLVYAGPMGKAVSGIGKLISTLASWKIFSGGAAFAFGAPQATSLANFFGALRTIGVSVASVAGLTANIAMVGGVIYEMGLIADRISGMDFTNFASNMRQITPALNEIFAMVSVITGLFAGGHLLSGGVSSVAIGIGELLSAGLLTLIEGVAHIIGSMADSMNKVANIDIPSTERIRHLGDAMKAIVESFDIDPTQASRINTNAPTFENMDSVISNITNIATNLKDLSDVELNGTEISKAGEKARQIVKAVGNVFSEMQKQFDMDTALTAALDSSQAGSMANILTQMNDGIVSIGTILTSISGMYEDLITMTNVGAVGKSRAQVAGERMAEMVDSVATVFQGILAAFTGSGGDSDTKFGELGWADQASNQMTPILTNMNTAILTVKTITETMFNMIPTLLDMTRKGGNNKSRLDSFSSMIGEMIGGIGDIFMGIKTQFVDDPDYDQLSWATSDTNQIDMILENINTAIRSVANIADAITDAQWILKRVTSSSKATEGKTPTYYLKENVEYMLKGINEMLVWMQDSNNLIDFNSTTDVVDKLDAIAGQDGAIAKIADISTRLFNMQDKVRNLFTTAEGDRSKTFELGKNLKRVFSGLKTAFDEISQGASNVYAMPAMADSLLQAIDDISAVVGRIRGMTGSANAIVSGEDGDVLGSLPTIFAGLKTAFDELGGDSSTIQATADAANNFAGALDEVNSSAGEAKTGIDNLKTSISELANMMMTKEGGLSSFGGRLNYVGAMASAAAGQVRSLANAINALPTEKTVRVNYVQNGGTVSALRGSVSSLLSRIGRRANGGMIPAYFSGGGLSFLPYGTDTVPAMLTPGEYVHRRAAVKAFGEQFMNRINNLDLTGALQALSLRAGSGIIPRQIPTVSNTYNRDNHAKVTQNIYSNNPNYGFKRANRWVRSL